MKTLVKYWLWHIPDPCGDAPLSYKGSFASLEAVESLWQSFSQAAPDTSTFLSILMSITVIGLQSFQRPILLE